MEVKFPFVGREHLEAAQRREQRLQEENDKLLGKIFALIDKLAEIRPEPPETRQEISPPSFVFPALVSEAIAQRAPRGSKVEGLLRQHAERRLSNGEADPEEVAKEILAGSSTFNEDEW